MPAAIFRSITPRYQRYAASGVPAAMKIRAPVVPGRVPPERRLVAASDPPRPKKAESASAGRVSRSRVPRTPARKSAKSVPVRTRKRITPASRYGDLQGFEKTPGGGILDDRYGGSLRVLQWLQERS